MSELVLNLSKEEIEIVQKILFARIPGRPVYAFGSRTTGKARRRSDLDLAVGGDAPLTLTECADLADDLDQSDLPITVDVVDLHGVTPEFRARIEREFVPIQAGSWKQEEVLA